MSKRVRLKYLMQNKIEKSYPELDEEVAVKNN